jgi:hypothetical protein
VHGPAEFVARGKVGVDQLRQPVVDEAVAEIVFIPGFQDIMATLAHELQVSLGDPMHPRQRRANARRIKAKYASWRIYRAMRGCQWKGDECERLSRLGMVHSCSLIDI